MASLTAILRSETERFGLGEFGVDTIALRFRPGWPEFVERLLLNARHRSSGGNVVFLEKPAGIVVALVGGVIRVEGRLDPLLTGVRESWGLRSVGDVEAGEVAARALVEELAGVPMDGGGEYFCDGELARFDLAHEFWFVEAEDGLAFLATLAALLPARRKVNVWRAADGTVQTVYFRAQRSGVVLERAYDKGVESGSHAAGFRVRLEAQRRLAKRRAMRPRALAGADVGGIYGQALAGFTAHESLAVGSDQAEERLFGLAAQGVISMRVAERNVGTIAALRRYGRGIYADSTGRRRLAELRSLGVSPEAVAPERVVPVGRLLRESLDSWAAP